MDKLKIVNPTAHDLGEAFGIPQDRRDALGKALDDMVKKASKGEAHLIYAVDIFTYIHDLCETQEEYTWALFNHIMWMVRNGRVFTTAELQEIAIKKYGNPQNIQP